jgi:glucokinase
MSEFKINPTPPILLADLGATNARFAMVTGPNQEQIGLLRSSDYPSLAAAAQAFLRSLGDGPRPTRAAFAVAAPVIGDLVTFTNLPWRFSIRDLRDALGLNHLDVINDLAATALGLPSLTPKDHRPIGDGIAEPGAPIAVLGPGSGLGVSGLLPGPTGGTVISGEGGHATLAASTDREAAVLAYLSQRLGPVSAEQVLSGPGLVTLYQAVGALNDQPPQPLTAAEITTAALTQSCPICLETLTLFCSFLGSFAGNLALTFGARGGVYIAGGIVPRFAEFLAHSPFRHRFTDKGQHASAYLAPIPTVLITHPQPTFLGLRACLGVPPR